MSIDRGRGRGGGEEEILFLFTVAVTDESEVLKDLIRLSL